MKSSEPQRIVIDARESGTTTGRYIDKLVQGLHNIKPEYQITVVTREQRAAFFREATPNFKVVKTNYLSGTFGEQYGLVWQLYGIKTRLVHFTMTQQPVLYFGDCITTIHDLTTARFRNPAKNRVVFGIKQMVYKWVIRRVAKKSRYVITPSEYVKIDLAEYANIDPDKIVVTYEAADKITDPPEPIHQLLSTNYLLYVGRAQPHKNLERLLAAYEIAKRKQPKLKLVLAGRKDILYTRLEKRAKKMSLEGVIFTDFVSEGQLRWLYENCAAYIFPSLSEGFGLPGLEAMIHGAPVLSSDATCLPEIYDEAALYFKPTDVEDMAGRINQLLGDDKLRASLIVKGRAQAAKYSWDKMARQTLEVYKKVGSKN